MEGGGQTGACPWWEGVGALPPHRKWKKNSVRGNSTSFTYVLLMKLGGGGDRYTIHAK